ncbi:hypothetical protein SAZ_34460 [Streptomyces noursei ZPM]|nr:hypothetical protein SAZ_34460 [Streptomyces noursei ZPM]EPY93078.1 hypothetical protein K530_49665 [Streptomyces noursei CCRC 11814]
MAPRIRCADQPGAEPVADADGAALKEDEEDAVGAGIRVFRAGTSPLAQPDTAARAASRATAAADLWRMPGC